MFSYILVIFFFLNLCIILFYQSHTLLSISLLFIIHSRTPSDEYSDVHILINLWPLCLQELLKELKSLKEQVRQQEKKIRALEAKVKKFEDEEEARQVALDDDDTTAALV